MNWTDLKLAPDLQKLIDDAGYKSPTEVQAKTFPLAVDGYDVMVSSQTGSGKTASFVIPMIERYRDVKGTFGVVLSPTREIAQQTQAVFDRFAKPLGISAVTLIGGIDMKIDDAALKTYPQIIVATPGRLCDHIERGNVWLDYTKVLVLDEADRMLDMGFSDQLNAIVKETPDNRQTMVFSATFPASVEKLAHKIMYEPQRITIGTQSAAPPKIEQRILQVAEDRKFSELMRLLRQEKGSVIVFVRSKDRASRLWQNLHSRGVYDATCIHSDCTQAHREKALAAFRAGEARILVATDVAGRGIDVEDVAHVVNYDLPMEAEDYVHRIGRTGRKGKSGIATTFATHRDRDIMRRIAKLTSAR